MSHTFEWLDGVTFIHNGDFSGDVEIMVESHRIEQAGRAPDGKPYTYVKIPFEAIEAIVAEKVRSELAAELETASVERLLYGPKGRKRI